MKPSKVRKYNEHDDFPGAQCPKCLCTGLVCTDGDKYFYCPQCNWNGSELEICDFIRRL